MENTNKYILLALLVFLPIIAAFFRQFGLADIATGFMASFIISVVISLFYFLEGGFSK